MRYLVFFVLGATVKLIEYKLWKNYGQIIPDTSSNNMHAVNGDYSSSDQNDCLYTDRGLYFSHQISSLRLPPNDKVQTIHRIPTPYTAILWVNNFEAEGRYFIRWMDQQYLTVKSFGPNTIGIVYKIQSYEKEEYSTIPSFSGI